MRLIILLIFISKITFGQESSKIDANRRKDSISSENIKDPETVHFYPSIGLSFQKEFVGEFSLAYGSFLNGGPCNPGGSFGLKLGSEFNFKPFNFYIGPKLSGEVTFMIIGLRLNVIDYTNSIYHDLKLTPEIGLSENGLFNLFYGYNFSLTHKNLTEVGTHRITLTFNIDFRTFRTWRE